MQSFRYEESQGLLPVEARGKSYQSIPVRTTCQDETQPNGRMV